MTFIVTYHFSPNKSLDLTFQNARNMSSIADLFDPGKQSDLIKSDTNVFKEFFYWWCLKTADNFVQRI